MRQSLLILVVIAVVWKFFFAVETVELGPGVKAPSIPKQSKVSAKTFSHQGYDIEALADFDIKAKILARKDYRYDRGAELSPVDLALGWGKMSDEEILQHINIWQSGRWYRWKTDHFPIPRREIETSSANMHMIPASKKVEDQLKRTRVGDIIHLKGKLVKVTNEEGFIWKSSLTRNDTGGGACELIWVESLAIQNP